METDEEYRIRDQKIVDGFIRNRYRNQEILEIEPPQDIIHLIFLFYHIVVIKEFFKNYNDAHYELSNNDKTVKRIGSGGYSVVMVQQRYPQPVMVVINGFLKS